MHPVCPSDGLFVSTGRGTPSAVSTHVSTPVVLSLSLGIPCKEALSLLTCSDIVMHVSSELCIVPTNRYSCHSSTVCIDSTCMVSWNHSVEYVHEHSVQFVCVMGRRVSSICLMQSVIWLT